VFSVIEDTSFRKINLDASDKFLDHSPVAAPLVDTGAVCRRMKQIAEVCRSPETRSKALIFLRWRGP
jgi:hypothetical protein